MKKYKSALMCTLLASTMLSDGAMAIESRFSANIQVVDVVSASAMKQLKFNVSVPAYKSITITSNNLDNLGLDVKDIQEGLYKINASANQTVSLSAEDSGNVDGVTFKGVEAKVGPDGQNQNLINDSVANLVAPDDKKDLKIKVAALDVDNLGNLDPASGSYFPEFNLDVSYE